MYVSGTGVNLPLFRINDASWLQAMPLMEKGRHSRI